MAISVEEVLKELKHLYFATENPTWVGWDEDLIPTLRNTLKRQGVEPICIREEEAAIFEDGRLRATACISTRGSYFLAACVDGEYWVCTDFLPPEESHLAGVWQEDYRDEFKGLVVKDLWAEIKEHLEGA